MLMTFSGCERIKNSLGLSSANVENPEIPENSNKAENPTPIYAVEQLTQQEEPPSVLQDQLNRIKRSMGEIFKEPFLLRIAEGFVVVLGVYVVLNALDNKLEQFAKQGPPAPVVERVENNEEEENPDELLFDDVQVNYDEQAEHRSQKMNEAGNAKLYWNPDNEEYEYSYDSEYEPEM